MKEKKFPSEKLTLTFGDNTYELSFPNIGQLIDLERAKGTRTQFASTPSGYYAMALNEAMVTFNILIPKLKEDLNVGNIYNMSARDSQMFVSVYLNTFKPWFDQWMEALNEL